MEEAHGFGFGGLRTLIFFALFCLTGLVADFSSPVVGLAKHPLLVPVFLFHAVHPFFPICQGTDLRLCPWSWLVYDALPPPHQKKTPNHPFPPDRIWYAIPLFFFLVVLAVSLTPHWF